jgi:hypothetical protein
MPQPRANPMPVRRRSQQSPSVSDDATAISSAQPIVIVNSTSGAAGKRAFFAIRPALARADRIKRLEGASASAYSQSMHHPKHLLNAPKEKAPEPPRLKDLVAVWWSPRRSLC